MPTYQYLCTECGGQLEAVQKFSDDPLTADPETGVPVERVLHAPAIHFKGSGFHNTDYGTRKRQREKESSSSSEGGSSSSGSSDGGGSGSGSDPGSGSSPSGKKDDKKAA